MVTASMNGEPIEFTNNKWIYINTGKEVEKLNVPISQEDKIKMLENKVEELERNKASVILENVTNYMNSLSKEDRATLTNVFEDNPVANK